MRTTLFVLPALLFACGGGGDGDDGNTGDSGSTTDTGTVFTYEPPEPTPEFSATVSGVIHDETGAAMTGARS